MQKIIDTHMHIFDLSRFRVLWLEDTPKLHKSTVLSDYVAAIGTNPAYQVIATEHVELDTILEQKKKENDYFVTVAQDKETLVAGITVYADMLQKDLISFLAPYCKQSCVKGVRYILHVPSALKGTCLQPQFIENARLLGKHNLLFEGCLRAEELDDFVSLVQQCPETQFVLDHMGLPDVTRLKEKAYGKKYKKDIRDLAALPNVSVKISGLSLCHVREIADVVNYLFDCFGEDRIMFASNFPVCTLSFSFDDWVTALLNICERRTQTFRDKFFYQNACKIYTLKGFE